eukprot:COSAG02_NODE_59332_length_274_cov_1.171429_1_plen_45_part_10
MKKKRRAATRMESVTRLRNRLLRNQLASRPPLHRLQLAALLLCPL